MLDGMDLIRRDFLVDELNAVRREASIDAVVTVQARQSLRETDWLLEVASRHDFMLGVVGWVPLTDPTVASVLENYASHPKLKAVRHVLHDEPDDYYVLRGDFNKGIGLLHRFGLCYDILILERHIPQTIEFVDRHPNQIFVVDHIAKPKIRERLVHPWREHMEELSKRENVYCKLSGLVTEADWAKWTEADLRPYIQIVLETFGPERVMFGSDWPVSLVACSYRRWVEIVQRAVSELSLPEQEAIFCRTARKAYRC